MGWGGADRILLHTRIEASMNKTLYVLIIHYQRSDLLVHFYAEDIREALQKAGEIAKEKEVDLEKYCDLLPFQRGLQLQFSTIPGEVNGFPQAQAEETP